jgi:hypothetical protein
MDYHQEKMGREQINYSRHHFEASEEDTNSSETTVAHENLIQHPVQRKGRISSTTKKLVFTSLNNIGDEAMDDKENNRFSHGYGVNELNFRGYDQDVIKTVEMSPNELRFQ